MSENITVVGLTGQTGAGKTTLCKAFEKKGFKVIDADIVAREVTEKGTDCLKKITEQFGEEILLEDGSLDRKKLGSIVFSHRDKLELLNSIIFPYISDRIVGRIREMSCGGEGFVLIDAPTLFESGTDRLCDIIVSVTADSSVRLERIMKRDNITREAALARMNAQHDEDFFRANSDYLIENNSDEGALLTAARETAEKIINGGH